MSARTEWWQTFFDGPWGRLQALGYPHERTQQEVDFVVRVLGLVPGERVLDVPCGTGRHASELARRGMRVTALDLNPRAIAAARIDSQAMGVALELVEGDMRELTWSSEFDAALCYFGSFGYFEDAENLRFAQAVARSLRPGGRFVIDTHVMESLFPRFRERGWSRTQSATGDVLVLEECAWNCMTRRVEASWTFVRPTGTESSSSAIRLYSCGELCELLRAAGFQSFEALETGTAAPFGLGSKRLSLVARLSAA